MWRGEYHFTRVICTGKFNRAGKLVHKRDLTSESDLTFDQPQGTVGEELDWSRLEVPEIRVQLVQKDPNEE